MNHDSMVENPKADLKIPLTATNRKSSQLEADVKHNSQDSILHWLKFIKSLYWNQRAFIRMEGGYSNEIKIKRGVRQRYVLSPCLFNLAQKSFSEL